MGETFLPELHTPETRRAVAEMLQVVECALVLGHVVACGFLGLLKRWVIHCVPLGHVVQEKLDVPETG